MMHIQINSFFGGWHNVDEDMARRFVGHLLNGMTAIPEEQKVACIETNYLKGITVKELMKE